MRLRSKTQKRGKPSLKKDKKGRRKGRPRAVKERIVRWKKAR